MPCKFDKLVLIQLCALLYKYYIHMTTNYKPYFDYHYIRMIWSSQ